MSNLHTERAREAILLACRIASHCGQQEVSALHLLWGILKQENSVGAQVMRQLGVSLQGLEAALERGAAQPVDNQEFAPETKQALEISRATAQRLGVKYIGTEHLLLGILQGTNSAVSWLKENGLEANRVIEAVMRALGYKPVNVTTGQPAQSGQPVGGAGMPGGAASGGIGGALGKYGRDLTALARQESLDPVLGRDAEIQRVVQILSRRTKNNPVLIGEPGVGKTAIAEGLAQRIAAGSVPQSLADKSVISLDISSLLAGAKYRGEFEERLQQVMEEIRQSGKIILFIDELHTLIGAGGAEGAIDAANILKPALARGELQCVGATTIDEYRKYIEKDAALERRFQPVTVNEPGEEEAIAILEGLRDRYEAHHGVKITSQAIKAAVTLSMRYLPDRYLPDKAIDLMDEAAAMVNLAGQTVPKELRKLEKELENVLKEKDAAANAQNFEDAAKWRDKEKTLRADLEQQKQAWEKDNTQAKNEVDTAQIAEVLSNWSGIPLAQLQKTEMEQLLQLESLLHKRVIGQDEAVNEVARAVRRGRAGLKDPKRPIGSFIFLGPTGVGKTELSKALANALFGTDEAMIRLDMSEYMEKHTVARLIGAPPGYIGHDEGGQLTEAVRRRPYSVILLDEIEKAHPDVFNILLQVLDDGRLTDSKGRTVDFRNTVIIMTSNLGSGETKSNSLGFATGSNSQAKAQSEYEQMKTRAMEAVKRAFRPEFINRIDNVLVFRSLQAAEIEQIAELLTDGLQQRLRSQELDLQIDSSVIKQLAEAGFDLEYGARPLKRAVVRLLEDPLSESLLAQKFVPGDVIWAWAENGQIQFGKEKPELKTAEIEKTEIKPAEDKTPAKAPEKAEPADDVEKKA